MAPVRKRLRTSAAARFALPATLVAAITFAGCGGTVAADRSGTSRHGSRSSTRAVLRDSASRPAAPAAPAYPRSFGVGIRTITFVDTSRPTLDYATNPPTLASDERRIQTQIRYPTLDSGPAPQPNAPPAYGYGPFPVIVFAHGYAVTPHTYEPMLDTWVEAGFVVVSPVFPVDNYFEWAAQGGGSAPEADIWNEPRDVAFVLHELAPLVAHPGTFVHGLLDLSMTAFAGQSDGADVMAALVYGKRFRPSRDELPVRPRAVGLFSGAELGGGVVYESPSPAPALLSVESDADYCNETQQATQLYDAVAGAAKTRFFLTLLGADHLGPYGGELPWSSAVNRVTTEFFELVLRPRDRPSSTARIEKTGDWRHVSSVSTAPAVYLAPTADLGDCGTPSPNPPGAG